MSTPIQVAYDISNLAAFLGRTDSITGINRVSAEVLHELSKRDGVEVTAVVTYGEDPLDDCTKASLYLEERRPAINCDVGYTFDPGRALTTAYRMAFRATQPAADRSRPVSGARSVALQYMRRFLHKAATAHRMAFPRTVFDRKRFDVFHCPHWRMPTRDVTGRVPRILTVYDLIPVNRPEFVDIYSTNLFDDLLKQIDVEKDWIVAISEFTKHEVCERTGMSPERVRVTPLAASPVFHPVTDPDAIASVRSRYGIPPGEYFLCLAAPQPRKNLSVLIQAFFRLLDAQALPDTYLVLAGSKSLGWNNDEVFATAASSTKHRSRLFFTGYVADEDLASLYSGAAAFVFPSLYEGFGLPALEAMQCGTPVITSNTTSLPEVVGDAAVLVDPTDADQLCEAMSAVLGDQALRSQLRQRGLQRAAQFSWKRCADITAEVYHHAARGA